MSDDTKVMSPEGFNSLTFDHFAQAEYENCHTAFKELEPYKRMWNDLKLEWQKVVAENKQLIQRLENAHDIFHEKADLCDRLRRRVNELVEQLTAATARVEELEKQQEQQFNSDGKFIGELHRQIATLQQQLEAATRERDEYKQDWERECRNVEAAIGDYDAATKRAEEAERQRDEALAAMNADVADVVLEAAATRTERDALKAVLREVMSWISNWSPSFTDYYEWTETETKVWAALGGE